MNTLISLLFIFISGYFSLCPMEKMLDDVDPLSSSTHSNGADVEFLSGRLYIQINELTYFNPVIKGRRRAVQKRTTISACFFGRISRHRVKLFLAKPSERLRCEAGISCPVFNGSTKFVLERDMNTMQIKSAKEYPLQVISKYCEQDFRWLKNKEQYVVTMLQQASGNNVLEGLNIEIKPYMPASNADGATLAPLKPSYVLWITGGRDWKMADEPQGPGTNLRWDDVKERLMPVNQNVSLGIPYEINTPEKPMYDGENFYEQLLWSDVSGFDQFLLNPVQSYCISAMGNRYYKDDYSESKTSITITMSMGPEDKLAPLQPVDDVDLTPLEPLGEEIPLTPLEPVK